MAKQAWRLLTNPTSLPARIFKAKYFPTTNILQVGLGPKPSFSWRSIITATNLLSKGLMWHVDDRKKIHIWKDKWMLRASSCKIQSTIILLSTNAVVTNLIDKKEG